MELVIDFDTNGGATAMHLDNFDLGFLGKKHIERVTEIKFDDETQTWGLFLPTDTAWAAVPNGQGFDSYETARQYEVSWLNICRYRKEEPSGIWGSTALGTLRSVGHLVSVVDFFKLGLNP